MGGGGGGGGGVKRSRREKGGVTKTYSCFMESADHHTLLLLGGICGRDYWTAKESKRRERESLNLNFFGPSPLA